MNLIQYDVNKLFLFFSDRQQTVKVLVSWSVVSISTLYTQLLRILIKYSKYFEWVDNFVPKIGVGLVVFVDRTDENAIMAVTSRKSKNKKTQLNSINNYSSFRFSGLFSILHCRSLSRNMASFSKLACIIGYEYVKYKKI